MPDTIPIRALIGAALAAGLVALPLADRAWGDALPPLVATARQAVAHASGYVTRTVTTFHGLPGQPPQDERQVTVRRAGRWELYTQYVDAAGRPTGKQEVLTATHVERGWLMAAADLGIKGAAVVAVIAYAVHELRRQRHAGPPRCPACGRVVPDGSAFCGQCGARLGAAI